MNILTFDLEEWYNEKQIYGGREWRYMLFDDCFLKLVDELDKYNLKATFFCVGKLAELRPDYLRLLVDHNHEVGCHSNVHTWLNKLSFCECREDTRVAIDSIEQCIGKKVTSYRAPAFSIDSTNPWVLEILASSGIEKDSSIFPAKRDHGGFRGFPMDKPCIVEHNGMSIKEFPISVNHIMGRDFVYSGGGYFRLLPSWLIQHYANTRDYSIWYFHLNDMIADSKRMMTRKEYEDYFKEKGTYRARLSHYIKNTIGAESAFEKLTTLMKNSSFLTIDQGAKTIDWAHSELVKI